MSCSLKKGAKQETNPVNDIIKQTQSYAAKGQYRKELEVYSGAYDKYHAYRVLRNNYIKAGNEIRSTADMAYQSGNFAEAGSIYRILYESHITAKDFKGSLSFDDDYLDAQVKVCSKALMEVGLAKYRELEFDQAISIWVKALSFNPDDKVIKDAIETATIQIQKLKNIK